ncbi:MAG: periplasmic heavy metal sensor [Calditrichaeota bacterium]|nr:MAG: periplasmic heavy metal sensor [Calditrichota bacterium]
MKKITIFAGLLFVFALSLTLFAQEEPKVPEQRIEKKVIRLKEGPHADRLQEILGDMPAHLSGSDLKLTEEQQKTFKKLDLAFAKETLSLRNELQVKRLEIDVETDEETPDVKKINTLIDDVHKLQAEIEKKEIATELKKRELLTPEQRKELGNAKLTPHKRMMFLNQRSPRSFKWFGDDMIIDQDDDVETETEIEIR